MRARRREDDAATKLFLTWALAAFGSKDRVHTAEDHVIAAAAARGLDEVAILGDGRDVPSALLGVLAYHVFIAHTALSISIGVAIGLTVADFILHEIVQGVMFGRLS